MKVLHVEAGKHYYGRARQVAYIIEGLAQLGSIMTLAGLHFAAFACLMLNQLAPLLAEVHNTL